MFGVHGIVLSLHEIKHGVFTLGRSPRIVERRFSADDIHSKAGFSPCERYRYYLVRRFGSEPISQKDRIAFIGLNPSTATEQVNDPTVRRCIGYARDWGYREFVMLNAYGLRSTDPKKLYQVSDPIGAGCDQHIRKWSQSADLVICCWGTHAKLLDRQSDLLSKLNKWDITSHCLGVTKSGAPKHPLYLRKDLRPIEFPGMTGSPARRGD